VFNGRALDLRPINRPIPDKIAYGMFAAWDILKTAKQALSKMLTINP